MLALSNWFMALMWEKRLVFMVSFSSQFSFCSGSTATMSAFSRLDIRQPCNIFQRPDMIRNTRLHGRGNAKRLMDFGEIVEHEMTRAEIGKRS